MCASVCRGEHDRVRDREREKEKERDGVFPSGEKVGHATKEVFQKEI